MKKILGWIKWVGGIVLAFLIYKSFKKDSSSEKQFEKAMKENIARRKEIEKERVNEKKRIKNMGIRDRVRDIKRMLDKSRNDKI